MSGLSKSLQPLARLAERALGIRHFLIKYKMPDNLPQNRAGLCYLQQDYYTAHIDVATDYGTRAATQREQGESLLHEMMHVALYEVETAADNLIDMIPEDEQDRARELFRKGLEQSTERISRNLYPIFIRSIKDAQRAKEYK